MEVSKYLIKAICIHMERVLTKCYCNVSDTKTLDAKRLASKDLKKLKRLLDE